MCVRMYCTMILNYIHNQLHYESIIVKKYPYELVYFLNRVKYLTNYPESILKVNSFNKKTLMLTYDLPLIFISGTIHP